MKVQLLFAQEYLAVLADDKLRAGETIAVVPILFTQGVNEKQSITNKHEYVHTHIHLSLSLSLSLSVIQAAPAGGYKLTEYGSPHQLF